MAVNERELTKEEQKSWFAFYCKHKGNLNAMVKDKTMPSGDWNFLKFCSVKYNWPKKFNEKLGKEAEEYRNRIIAKLGAKKLRAIERFYELLEDKEIEIYDKKTDEFKKVKLTPTYKELEAALKAIKTELGEPSFITKSENLNVDETTRQLQEQVAALINRVDPNAVQGEREAPGDSTKVQRSVDDDSNEEPSSS